MSAEQLITKHLDIWTSAHKTRSSAGRGSSSKLDLYGIKKLRELILELAVRGKLVPQDPNDEPASELLKRITAERTRLIKEGKIKKEKPLPEITDEEELLILPNGWELVRLARIADVGTGATPSRSERTYYEPAEVNWVTSGETDQEYIRETHEKVSMKAVKETNVSIYPSGTLIVAMYGQGKTRGQITELLVEAGTNQACAAISLIEKSDVHRKFIKLFFLKSYDEIRKQSAGGAQPNLNVGKISTTVIPIPSIAEQHRIVAKVDELMAFCDQLEKAQTDNIAAHAQLVEALLTTLTGSKDHQELQTNWQRIAEHFDTLFTTEDSIDQLKQTILQLAVMGKLVPQDPNDEPASELLKKIAAEKAQLIKEGKIKKEKPLPEITEEEKPFALPKGWEWTKFGWIAEFINGDRGKNYPNVSEYVDQGIAWINTGHIEPNGTLTVADMNYITRDKFDSLRGGKIQNGDLVYCLRGATFGKTAFVTPYSEGAIASSLMIIRPYIIEINSFIYRYLISNTGRSQIFRFDNGSAQPNLSASNVMLYVFPLPPLKEQHRIVAKVQELTALCDVIKTEIQSIQNSELRLADALVEKAVS